MDSLITVVALTLAAGLAIPLGALVAGFENIQPRWLEDELRHGMIAFGGGALLSAVALVLVPEGAAKLPPVWVAFFFLGGGLAFMALDILMHAIRTPMSQMVAMLSDFIPEALAMGAAFAAGEASGPLLALIIALQNLPEGFNSYRELDASTSFGRAKLLSIFAVMPLLGPVAGVAGHHWLGPHPQIVGAIMLFSAGGILYVIFEDVAPQAKLDNHWAPPFAAVAGFALGLMGQLALVPTH